MEKALAALADAIVPGVGTVGYALDSLRRLVRGMQAAEDQCHRLHVRFERVWGRLEAMARDNVLPALFRLEDFTLAIANFHSVMQKQQDKSTIMRLVTAPALLDKLCVCHEALDMICETLAIDQVAEMTAWHHDWAHQSETVLQTLTALVSDGEAVREDVRDLRSAMEALTIVLRELAKERDQPCGKRVAYLQTMHDQLVGHMKATPLLQHQIAPAVPPWFFTFDDVEYDREAVCLPRDDAQGSSHLGTWGSAATPVVVKCLRTAPTPTQQSSWREVDVWWQLRHPNVLRLYGASHVAQPAFLVSEYASLGNIREYLYGRPRPPQPQKQTQNQSCCTHRRRRLWRLCHDAALGLAYLHDKRVVHGNLKCSNILVGDDLRARLSDFGFSQLVSPTTPSVGVGPTDISASDQEDTSPPPGGHIEDDYVRIGWSWHAPELIDAAVKGEPLTPSFASDVYALVVCMLELLRLQHHQQEEEKEEEDNAAPLSCWDRSQFLAKRMRNIRRPRGIPDEAWDLIKRMSCEQPGDRMRIHQVCHHLHWLARQEAADAKEYGDGDGDGPDSEGAKVQSVDVDQQRVEYEQNRPAAVTSTTRLQTELELLRAQIREEERALERVFQERRRADLANVVAAKEGKPPKTMKLVLRHLRWGTCEEQSRALAVLADPANEFSSTADEIARQNGLEVLVACMKHGHSSAFRVMAMEILQAMATMGTGWYLDAVLEHGVTQILMSVLHYRRIPSEQLRAAQFLLALAVQSSRARTFFLQNAGIDLLVQLLWRSQLLLRDDRFRQVTEPVIRDEIDMLLAAQAEVRANQGARALDKNHKDVAVQRLTEAILLDPRNGRHFAMRSEVYSALSKYENAARDALQCIKRLPDYGEGYYRHAIALFGMNYRERGQRAVKLGRQRDSYYFTRDRLAQLAFHAGITSSRDDTGSESDAGSVAL